jgi:6-pyruvoyltetrahydropterin/6-carboxytetrahydropterin synthase
MFEIYKEFRFDAAHTLGGEADDDPRYSRIHGHSFVAQVYLRGRKGTRGWVIDLGEVEKELKSVREQLDHRYLNELEGLRAPTMENIAEYIWNRVAKFKGLYKVVVRRDSCGEGCTYFGPSKVSGERGRERAKELESA